jgi:hypothetical protein
LKFGGWWGHRCGQTFKLLVFRDCGWWRFRHLPTRVDRDGGFALKTPVLVVLKRVVIGVSRRVNCEDGGFCLSESRDKHRIVAS